MTRQALDAPTTLWVVLILLSTASLALFEGNFTSAMAGTAIILLAAIKSRLVILHYMEAHRAKRSWRLLYETWNFSCAALLIVANLITLTQQG